MSAHAPSLRRRGAWVLVAVLASLGAVTLGPLAGGGAASASPSQTDCPPEDVYGCPGTSLPGQVFTPTITLEVRVGPAGVTTSVNACGYDPGDASATGQITFNGSPVVDAVLDSDGCLGLQSAAAGPIGLVEGELAAGVAAPGYPRSFTVPALAAGTYQVCSVFPGYSTPCTEFQIVAEASSNSTGRSGGGSLARTGFTVLGFVLVAIVLVLAGRAALEHSRRRTSAG